MALLSKLCSRKPDVCMITCMCADKQLLQFLLRGRPTCLHIGQELPMLAMCSSLPIPRCIYLDRASSLTPDNMGSRVSAIVKPGTLAITVTRKNLGMQRVGYVQKSTV